MRAKLLHKQELKLKTTINFGIRNKIKKDFVNNWLLYLMVLPVVAYYIIFHYIPMFGVIIAFKKFSMNADLSYFQSIVASPWVGLKYFNEFLNSLQFVRVMTNTIRISLCALLFGFPAPIILAIMINEVKALPFKKIVQTFTYMPHFISLVVICGMIRDFTSDSGFISIIISYLTGKEPTTMLNNPSLFTTIYVLSDIWQSVGWSSIIYLAALMNIDTQLYEAAEIDGAGRWKQALHVTLPGIMPTITIMFILRMGGILNVGFEKIILLYNPLTKSVANVISSYTYQVGLIDRNWSYSTAIGFFNSVINLIFLYSANWMSRKFNESSLW